MMILLVYARWCLLARNILEIGDVCYLFFTPTYNCTYMSNTASTIRINKCRITNLQRVEGNATLSFTPLTRGATFEVSLLTLHLYSLL